MKFGSGAGIARSGGLLRILRLGRHVKDALYAQLAEQDGVVDLPGGEGGRQRETFQVPATHRVHIARRAQRGRAFERARHAGDGVDEPAGDRLTLPLMHVDNAAPEIIRGLPGVADREAHSWTP